MARISQIGPYTNKAVFSFMAGINQLKYELHNKKTYFTQRFQTVQISMTFVPSIYHTLSVRYQYTCSMLPSFSISNVFLYTEHKIKKYRRYQTEL